MTYFFVKYFIPLLITAVFSYLIGAINSSLIVTKWLGINKDIRTMGSGNAGFTNALRTVGKKAAILTFAGDFTKGVLAVFLALKISTLPYVAQDENNMLVVKLFCFLASFMCVLGHMYPCFFGFKGGKGILTAWASSLLIDYRIFLILISVFLIVLFLTKIVSISSICAAISYPIATIICFINSSFEELIIFTSFAFITASIVIFKHKNNIKRLLKGTEKTFSESKVR